MTSNRRSLWAWGSVADEPTLAASQEAAGHLGGFLGLELDGTAEAATPFDPSSLSAPRVAVPVELAEIVTDDARERAERAWGRSYQDVVRAFRGDFSFAPDLVALPRDEAEIAQLLEWASGAGVAVIPYGGGTSVVGGVRAEVPAGYNGVLTLDTTRLDRLLELDEVSGAARIAAGASGPKLEKQLTEHGVTMRFFPQSFALTTLGGWVATRAGGHFATVETHIDDLVESIRAITPAGVWQSFRLPASGAGVSPDRMLLGSEGTLGVITEAWVRVRPRPTVRAQGSFLFDDFTRAAEAVREIAQSGLRPSNCRLIEDEEARFTMAGDGSGHLLVLAFESAGAAVAERFEQCAAIVRSAGGRELAASSGGGAENWRETFMRAPQIRDTLVACGVLVETFETVTTWDRFAALRTAVVDAAERVAGAPVKVTCRFTHVYPDGPAPYFTVMTRADRGGEVDQWQAIKRAVSDCLNEHGASITHHHAVGRDHRPWYDRQRPDLLATALRAAKRELDPGAILNPGCLYDPLPPR